MKKAYRLIACVFVLFLAISISVNTILSDAVYSEIEKRELEQFPQITAHSVFSGKFTSDFDKYASDQFFARNSWVWLKNMSQYGIGHRLLNGVYITPDRYMRELEINEEQLNKNIDAIKALAEKTDVPITLLIAPEAISIYYDELPAFATVNDQDRVVEEIRAELGDKINIVYPKDELLAHKNEYIYFKGDHHWTARGALYAYNALRKSQGKTELAMPEFTAVNTEFRGAMVSKAGAVFPWIGLDTIEVAENINNDQFAVVINRGEKDEDGAMFVPEHLESSDKYRYFQGGDHPIMAISSAMGNGSALVMKDSFCSILLPYLASDYKTTYVADARYNRQSPSEYAKSMGVSEIILVYSADSLCNEYSLMWLGN